MKRHLLILILAAALLVAFPLAASANDCINLSRPAGNVPDSAAGLVTKGNWVWLPSVCNIFDCGGQQQPPLWLFLPPGAGLSLFLDNGSFHGNYTNGVTDHLLGRSAICAKFPYETSSPRQTDRGIQNDCVAP